jgi:hypothetical protein
MILNSSERILRTRGLRRQLGLGRQVSVQFAEELSISPEVFGNILVPVIQPVGEVSYIRCTYVAVPKST